MKVHIFVATTQGLVAVQKIYEQDPEIGSVVSVNGTATISPITQAYRSFVNKGVGIIESDFGLPSYRVNIDRQIDQGNSWQLGFYLAHAAYAQGVLGNGDVAYGDMVLCATGEINTSERTILAVEQVPLKISKANHTATSWPKAVARFFLIPEENQVDTNDEDPILPTKFVSSLDDALLYLPAQAASEQTISEQKIVSAAPTNTPALITPVSLATTSERGRKILTFLGFVVVVSCLVAYQQGLFEGWLSNSTGVIQVDTPTVKTHVRDGVQDIALSDSDEVQMILTYGAEGQCAKINADKKIQVAQEYIFEPATHAGLCEIKLTGLDKFLSVIAINKHTHRFVVAVKSDSHFTLPVPTVAAEYMVIAFKNIMTVEDKNRLWSFLFNQPDRQIVTPKDLAEVLLNINNEYKVYTHSFVKE